MKRHRVCCLLGVLLLTGAASLRAEPALASEKELSEARRSSFDGMVWKGKGGLPKSDIARGKSLKAFSEKRSLFSGQQFKTKRFNQWEGKKIPVSKAFGFDKQVSSSFASKVSSLQDKKASGLSGKRFEGKELGLEDKRARGFEGKSKFDGKLYKGWEARQASSETDDFRKKVEEMREKAAKEGLSEEDVASLLNR